MMLIGAFFGKSLLYLLALLPTLHPFHLPFQRIPSAKNFAVTTSSPSPVNAQHHSNNDHEVDDLQHSSRNIIQTTNDRFKHQLARNLFVLSSTFSTFTIINNNGRNSRSAVLAQTTGNTAPEPEITNKVYLDIKISNYTEESIGTNQGGYGSGRIVIGLFGKNAPLSTALFLQTIESNGIETPSYIGSLLNRIDEETGLLQLNGIGGLNEVSIAGKTEYEYDEKILNYQPILETSGIRHDQKGLLTRRQFSTGPNFAITTRKCEELDTFHTVFGKILEGIETLDAITDLPRYSATTKTGYLTKEKGFDGVIADSWFQSQRNFYITAGKILGDPRAVDRRGKLLRRVLIKGSGVID